MRVEGIASRWCKTIVFALQTSRHGAPRCSPSLCSHRHKNAAKLVSLFEPHAAIVRRGNGNAEQFLNEFRLEVVKIAGARPRHTQASYRPKWKALCDRIGTSPADATAWWWSTGGSAPETMVIDEGTRPARLLLQRSAPPSTPP